MTLRPALAAVLLALAAPATAQSAPLEEALQAFARDRGVRLVYAGPLVAGRRTRCPAAVRTSSRPADAVLACLLEGTGVEARRLPSGTVALYAAAPAPTVAPARPEAPRAVTLSGMVTDASTGEALVGATVYAPTLGRGATTNAYGFYSLTLPPGRVRLVASYVGMTPTDTTLVARDGRRDLALAPSEGGLGGVVVEAIEARVGGAYPSVARTGDDVQALPALLGEADLLKALQTEPGVGGGVEGTAGLHVRGGTPDQTLVLLDGVPVYNASHLFGFLSTFNAEAVRHVELFKGGFPARYGGRLSSVVDVRMREGNAEARAGHARVGLLSSGAVVEGPLGSGSYLVAGRRTYLDLLARPVLAAAGGLEGATPIGAFSDLNVKANAAVSPADRLYLSVYAGRDRYGVRGVPTDDGDGELASALGWGNTTAALRWTRALSDRAFAATTLTASDYRFEVGIEAAPGGGAEPFGARYRSGIGDLSLRTDVDWRPAAGHAVRVGGSAARHRYRPGLFVYDPPGADADTTLGAAPVGSWEGALYAEDEVALGPARVSVGLRASGYAVGGAAFGALEPRLAARVGLGRGLEARASVARMAQYLHLLPTVGGIGLPTDVWVPATARFPPGRSWQVAAGLAGRAGRLQWSADGYAKTMTGLVTLRGPADLARADDDWQNLLTTGTGRAAGLEVALAYAGPRTTARLAYTLARSDRRFDGVEGGARFPYRYDRTHDLGVGLRHRLSRRVDVSAGGVAQTGLPFTAPTATYTAPFPGYDLSSGGAGGGSATGRYFAYGPRHGARLPATLRLDVGVDWYFRRGPRPHALSLHVYNATNRVNPAFARVEQRFDEASGVGRRTLVGQGILPVLPSLSYQFSF